MAPTIFTIIYDLLLFFCYGPEKIPQQMWWRSFAPLEPRRRMGRVNFPKTSGMVNRDRAKHFPIGSSSKGVFEWRTSTGSEDFSPLICHDAIKFVLLSFFTLEETMTFLAKPLLKNVKSPLPVDLGRSKTPLRKFPNSWRITSNDPRSLCES